MTFLRLSWRYSRTIGLSWSTAKFLLRDKSTNESQPKKEAKESSSSEDESSKDESEDEKPKKTPKKDTDVVMKNAPSAAPTKFEKKEPKTPSQNQTPIADTLFVGNFSFEAGEEDISEFFGQAGEVVGVRLATNQDGSLWGFGHVTFSCAEEAKKVDSKKEHGRQMFRRRTA